MDTKNLFESATLIESSDTGPWKVRLISEGKGSSGTYPASTLESYKSAFNGVLSFENHPGWMDGPESRNFTQIVGKVLGETWTDTDERGKVGVYANWEPDPEHRDRLSRYKENLGLSIFIEGDGHNDEDGEFVVDSFNEHDAFRSVDVVIAAGRGGRFEESQIKDIYSRRRETIKTDADTSVSDRKDIKMDEKAMEMLESINTALTTLVSAQDAEAKQTAQVEADDKAVEGKMATLVANLDAVETARENLLPSQVKSLLAEARKGGDITDAIATQVALAEEVRGESGRVTESGRVKGSEGTSSTFGAWK